MRAEEVQLAVGAVGQGDGLAVPLMAIPITLRFSLMRPANSA